VIGESSQGVRPGISLNTGVSNKERDLRQGGLGGGYDWRNLRVMQ